MLTALLIGLSGNTDLTWKKLTDSGFHGAYVSVSDERVSSVKSSIPNLNGERLVPICSVTKLMTAQVVLELASQRKLSLDDTVCKHLPWLPTWARSVSIQQLLTHTSGFRSMDEAGRKSADGISSVYLLQAVRPPSLRNQILQVIGPKLAGQPGKTYLYNNADFLILQAVIEHVLAKPFATILRERIFKPAGMQDSTVASWGQLPKSVLLSYQVKNGAKMLETRFNFGAYGAAGSVISNLNDIGRWLKWSLSRPKLMSPILIGAQFQGFQGYGGYAYSSDVFGKTEPIFERPGAIANYSWQVSFLPERGIAIAVFSPEGDQKLGSFFEKGGPVVELAKALANK